MSAYLRDMNETFVRKLEKAFIRLCEKTEVQARVSLIVAVSIMVATFGSVCAATAANRQFETEIPVSFQTTSAEVSGASEYIVPSATEETSPPEVISIIDKNGELALPAVENELVTLTATLQR